MSVNYFLKIEGIPSESSDAKHKDEIEVRAWNWGETLPSAPHGGGSGESKVQMQPLHVIAYSSLASPKLFLACAKGQHISKAELSAARLIAGQEQDYMIWKLSDVIVTSYEIDADNDDPASTNEFNLDFAKIEVEYKPIKLDGSLGNPITAGWDLKSSKPI